MEIRYDKSFALRLIDELKQYITENGCSDEFIAEILAKYHNEIKGYVSEESFVNYDDAMKMLDIHNRTKFRDICKQHGIENIKFRNRNIGFRREDIKRLLMTLKRS